jgi:RimJ/RimL family protein N-acetyltransferase
MTLADRLCWNLYYRFKPAAWGCGYATEAVAEALLAAEAVAAARPVVARTGPDNAPSSRVAERTGLLRTPHLDGDGYIVFTLGW